MISRKKMLALFYAIGALSGVILVVLGYLSVKVHDIGRIASADYAHCEANAESIRRLFALIETQRIEVGEPSRSSSELRGDYRYYREVYRAKSEYFDARRTLRMADDLKRAVDDAFDEFQVLLHEGEVPIPTRFQGKTRGEAWEETLIRNGFPKTYRERADIAKYLALRGLGRVDIIEAPWADKDVIQLKIHSLEAFQEKAIARNQRSLESLRRLGSDLPDEMIAEIDAKDALAKARFDVDLAWQEKIIWNQRRLTDFVIRESAVGLIGEKCRLHVMVCGRSTVALPKECGDSDLAPVSISGPGVSSLRW
ncbi:hypothetical protein [Thioalkalivibrio denitrificans]|nr:hypothetical protein [Thioalkalivibrio denitrificans]